MGILKDSGDSRPLNVLAARLWAVSKRLVRTAANERDVEFQFVTPLIHGLGWRHGVDSFAQPHIRPNKSGGCRKIGDFALRPKGDEQGMIIEAKGPNGSTWHGANDTLPAMARSKDWRWLIVTDGQVIEVYDKDLGKDTERARIARVELGMMRTKDVEIAHAARVLGHLRRSTFPNGLIQLRRTEGLRTALIRVMSDPPKHLLDAFSVETARYNPTHDDLRNELAEAADRYDRFYADDGWE